MMNLMLHEICVRQWSNPLPVDAGASSVRGLCEAVLQLGIIKAALMGRYVRVVSVWCL